MNENKKRAQMICVSAVMIAFSVVISLICEMIPFLNLPFGGGFTVASMLPIIVVAYMYGTRWGIITAFTYSALQMLLSFNTVSAFFLPGDSQMIWWRALLVCLIDYVLAYTLLGLGGIFRKKYDKPRALCLGSVVALSLRYLAHIVSGAIFFGTWAEWFFTQDGFPTWGQNIVDRLSGAWLSITYSVIYNGLYMIPEIVITAICALFIARVPQIRISEQKET